MGKKSYWEKYTPGIEIEEPSIYLQAKSYEDHPFQGAYYMYHNIDTFKEFLSNREVLTGVQVVLRSGPDFYIVVHVSEKVRIVYYWPDVMKMEPGSMFRFTDLSELCEFFKEQLLIVNENEGE